MDGKCLCCWKKPSQWRSRRLIPVQSLTNNDPPATAPAVKLTSGRK